MLKRFISKNIDTKKKLKAKAGINKAKKSLINKLYAYDGADMQQALKNIGISETDTLFVHSNFSPDSGFSGTPLDMVNALVDLVGEKGNLLMVSIPFRGSSFDYLSKGKTFSRKKTISMMGLVTEMFRRKKGVKRSLHPTHPVLAYGKDSEWIVEGHERCLYPCGVGSPFEKFRELKGKILFYDVSFGAITFFHYVEDITRDLLPFDVYNKEPFEITVRDYDDSESVMKTYAFSTDVTRDAYKLEQEMVRAGKIKNGKVGHSRFLLVEAEDVVQCQTSMIKEGRLPYGR